MAFTDEQKKALNGKLDESKIATRQQAGQTLSYVEGWHAIAEANRIFGFDGWSRETARLEESNRELLTIKKNGGEQQQWRVGYIAVVKITVFAGDQIVTRVGTGFGSGMGRPEALGDAIESAVKEAETDATKRALATFGWPFGLALYDKSRAHVGAPEPEPPSDTERRMANDLRSKITATRTFEELDAVKKSTDFVSTYKSLPRELQQEVAGVGAEHREYIAALAAEQKEVA